MTTGLSLYLDAVRFIAAFAVFLSHSGRVSGGMFWQVQPYGHTAVVVFFVLSGFVIAWVTEARERTVEEYTLSRIARLYSVIIPAVILTALLDPIGMAIDPHLYAPESIVRMDHGPLNVVLGYILTLACLGQNWTLEMFPGSDIAFWSIDYEAWYYILFGLAMFLEGGDGWWRSPVAALLAGPRILIDFPLWLMGLAAWRWRAVLPRQLAAPVALGAVAVFIGLQAAGGEQLFYTANSLWLPTGFSLYDYIVGVLVALLFLGLANASLPVPGAALQRPIRFFAGTTFGLYLLHQPLLNFFGTIIPGPPERAMHGFPVIGLSFVLAVAIAHVIERQKGPLKRALRSGIDLVRRRLPRPALQGP